MLYFLFYLSRLWLVSDESDVWEGGGREEGGGGRGLGIERYRLRKAEDGRQEQVNNPIHPTLVSLMETETEWEVSEALDCGVATLRNIGTFQRIIPAAEWN